MFTRLVFPLIRPKMERGSALRLNTLLAFLLAGGSAPYLLGVLALVLACPFASGQNTEPAPLTGRMVKPTLEHLYWHMFNYQIQLDLLASKRAQQGQDPSSWRNHLQRKMAFSDTDYAKVRTTAYRLDKELQALGAQARAAIKANQAAYATLPGSGQSQPLEISIMLQQQREALIRAEVASLRSALGPKLSAFLDKFLQAQLVQHPEGQMRGGVAPVERLQHLMQVLQQQKEAQ